MISVAAERANRLEQLAVLRDQDFVNVGEAYAEVARYVREERIVPPSVLARYDAAKAAYERTSERIIVLLLGGGR